MHMNGYGVPKNILNAFQFFLKGAKLEDPLGQQNIAYMYMNGKGVKRNKTLAYMWYNLAAANGSTTASKQRDRIGLSLKSSELQKAQDLSITCLESNYDTC